MATILIVDDLAANRKYLVTLLASHGHRTIEAEDGSAGLAAVRAERPDLVITDVLMPVMDGYALVRALRADPATAAIPVVFYTAHYGEREAKALALASGVSYVLVKPAVMEAVLKIVERALSGETEPGAAAGITPLSQEFDREHLRLVTDKLSEKAADLRSANTRLRALVNIGLEIASERDTGRLVSKVCDAARELFSASYVTLGILDRAERTVQRVGSCGAATNSIGLGDRVSGLLSRVVDDHLTVRGVNESGDPTLLGLPAGHPEIRSYLAAPISSSAYVYGWICLVSNEGGSFTDEDEQLVVAMSGQVGRIYELEHEIQERGRAELTARLERDRAQRYFDTADVILLALDTEGTVTDISRKGCAVLGWAVEELIGQNWFNICLPVRTRVPAAMQFHESLEQSHSTVDSAVLTKSGEERMIEWHNTVLRDARGVATGTLSSGTDITERNRAASAVRAAEERMRFAMQNADVGIWDMDYRTGTMQWSETAEAHYGLLPGTFPGTFEAFLGRIHPDDRDSFIETVRAATQSGSDFVTQHRAVWPDGTVRWMSGSGRIQLGSDGSPVRGTGITMDITERRKLEEQYLQAQKMEAIGRLAGGVAHDFNNLLTVILGYCELLLSELDAANPLQADITEIQKAGISAAALTRQLLAFSRKQIIEPTLLDVNVVVSDMRAMFARLITEDVTIVMALRPEPAFVRVDRSQLEQILMNLVVNAKDAMPKGGTLRIATANVQLDGVYTTESLAVFNGPHVALTVSDTGTGMTAEVRKHLFEPFFTTKEHGKGTGLGLATVHGIVTQNGGSISVHSDSGGTSFTVRFPHAEGGEDAVELVPVVLRSQRTAQTVLLVEDAEGVRELATRLLERQGYTVLVAANSEEAIRLFGQTSSIDVLLTDVVMPGGSGPELAQALMARSPTLKVIYMSGYNEEAIVQHGVLKPGIALLHKPFTSEELRKKIREVS